MKYSVSIDIRRPLAHTVALYDDPANLPKWMEGLKAIEPISGTPGAVGAKSRIIFQMGKREMVMTETILANELPKYLSMQYEANGVLNIVNTYFEVVSPEITRCTNEQDFRFKGFMRLMAWLMPGAFKKQSMKYLVAFKEFAERN